MDYILFGMGFGASLMLIGWALRTFGPDWKYAGVTDDASPDLYVCKRFWNRFVQGLGGVLAIAGSGTVLLTFLVMLSNPDDDTGTMFSIVVWLFVTLVVLGWCLTYLSHYGCTGIWSPEEGYGFRTEGKPSARSRDSLRSRPSSTRATALVSPEDSASAEMAHGPDMDLSPDDLAIPVVQVDDSDLAVSDDDSVTEEDAESDSEYDFGDSTDVTVTAEPISREIHLKD